MLTWLADLLTPVSVVILGVGIAFLAIFFAIGRLEGRDSPEQQRGLLSRANGIAALLGSLIVALGVLALDPLTEESPAGLNAEPAASSQPRYMPFGTHETPAALVKGSAPEGGRLEPGMVVPDFTLLDVQTGASVRFSQFRANRPTVLILGSFGCNLFYYQLEQLRQLQTDFQSKAAFLFVKVKDAGHPFPSQLQKAFEEADMKSETQNNRLRRASLSTEIMDFPVPCLLDDEDRHVEMLYGAFPKRLVIVDADGRVALDVGKGMGKVKEMDDYGGWDFDAIESCLLNLP